MVQREKRAVLQLKPSVAGRIFQVYAGLAWIAGLLLFAWGPIWFGVDLPGLPFYKASLIRVTGGAMIAAGCFAAAMSRIEDTDAQKRALKWFGVGHLSLSLVLLSQQAAIWESPLVDRIIFAVF